MRYARVPETSKRSLVAAPGAFRGVVTAFVDGIAKGIGKPRPPP
jgi:hypothetical protein